MFQVSRFGESFGGWVFVYPGPGNSAKGTGLRSGDLTRDGTCEGNIHV